MTEKEQLFRSLLVRCLPIVQADAQMSADLTRFAPLAQRKYDITETDSERLVREIPEALAQ